MTEETTKFLLNDFFKKYNYLEYEKLLQAYKYASIKHQGQIRDSGEPYINHPLEVANILAKYHADIDTLCAALLHDTLEDTDATFSEIENLFGKSVASLVQGVTNLTKMKFYDKTELDYANIRRLLLGMTKDVRIVLIKIADRLHNMRTLNYKKVEKQKAKAMETIEIYVHLAKYLGLYSIKVELEDLCFMYLKPDKYSQIKDIKINLENNITEYQRKIIENINRILNNQTIPNEVKSRVKGIYGIFKSLSDGQKLDNIPDLIIFRIILKKINECYLSLRYLHSSYKPIPGLMIDYIAEPMGCYQAFHTTVMAPEQRLIQLQLQTQKMATVADNGIMNYWHLYGSNGIKYMQNAINEVYPLKSSIIEINKTADSNKDFVERIKGEVFSKKITVYDESGKEMQIPAGSTVLDFAYYLHSEIGDKMVGAIVDGTPVDINYLLDNNNRIRIITDPNSLGPLPEWKYMARTRRASKKINESLNKRKKKDIN